MRKTDEWIAKYPCIQRMEKAITGPRRMGSPNTLEKYVQGVQKFVTFMGYEDPESLLVKIRRGEVDAGGAVDEFIDNKLERYAHRSVRAYCYGVKKWLAVNGVELNWNLIEFPTSSEQREFDDAPNKEQLRTLMTHSATREKALIEVLTSSGLRIGTLLSLRVGDVDFNYPDVARITVRRKRGRKFGTGKRGRRAGKFHTTFITPEAKEVLLEYLKERERGGEQLRPESPLITDAWNKGSFLTLEGYERVWYRLLNRAGLDQKSVNWYIYHIHTLRKYFRSNCVGVDPSYRERWMGHKGGYLDESYFKADEHRHLEQYRRAIPHLSIYRTPESETWKTVIRAIARTEGRLDDDRLKRLEEVLARAKTMDEALTEFRRLKDPTFEGEEENPYEAKMVEEKELIPFIERGYEIVKELDDGRYIMKRPNRHS